MAVAVVDVRVDSLSAVRNLQQISSASKSTELALGGITKAVGPLLAAFSAIGAAKFVFAKTAELETQTRSIQTLTGSAQQAKQIIAELQQLGAVTPFTSTELIDAAKRLQSFGVEANKVVETTRRLADVSGATGAELQGLVTAYGQVQAKGRLQGEELLQFQERGIALQEELRKMYGMTGEEFQKALSKGRISAEAVEVAVVRLTEKGGKYANGAIAQSTTLAGKFSTLQDGIEGIARSIGTALSPVIKAVLNEAIFAVNAINQLISTGARAKGFGLSQSQRKDILDQAQREAAQIVNMRRVADPFERNRQFQELAAQRERDLIEAYGIRTGQVKPAAPAPAMATAVPRLFAGKNDGKASRISMEDLVGGVIQQRLQENKALMETQKINALNAASMAANAEQAKRMVDFAFQYKEVQLEINALQETLAKREQFRDLIIAKSKDKENTKLALLLKEDEIRSAITVRQHELNTIFAKHQQQIISASVEDQKRLDQQVKVGQERMQQLIDEAELLQAKLVGNEAEVMLRQQIRDIMKESAGLDTKNVEDQVKKVESLKKQLTIQEQIKTIYEDIGMSIKSGVVDAIQGAIDGTKSLQQVAVSLLNSIANKLLDVAVNMALFGTMSGTGTGGGLLGAIFKKRAIGGSVTAGQPYLVGERGPELFMPGRSGGIAPTGSFGGSAVNVTVNVTTGGSSVQGDQAQGKQLGLAISAAVQSELIKQKRPGGLLA